VLSCVAFVLHFLHEYASCDGQLCISLEAREVAGMWGTVPAPLKFFVLDCR
jgi:hypothetical protein